VSLHAGKNGKHADLVLLCWHGSNEDQEKIQVCYFGPAAALLKTSKYHGQGEPFAPGQKMAHLHRDKTRRIGEWNRVPAPFSGSIDQSRPAVEVGRNVGLITGPSSDLIQANSLKWQRTPRGQGGDRYLVAA